MSTTAAPAIGSKVRAATTTATAQSVVIEIASINQETPTGWLVYGYRAHRGSRPRQTMYPRLYWVARSNAEGEQ